MQQNDNSIKITKTNAIHSKKRLVNLRKLQFNRLELLILKHHLEWLNVK